MDFSKHPTSKKQDVKMKPDKPEVKDSRPLCLLMACVLLVLAIAAVAVTFYFTLWQNSVRSTGQVYIGLTPSTKTTQHPDAISVSIIFENSLGLENQKDFRRTVNLITMAKPVYPIILDMLKDRPHINVTFSSYPDFGHFVESVNGIYGNHSLKTFWALIMHAEGQTPCLTDVGVDHLIPDDGDVIIIQLQTYSVFDIMPSCTEGGGHDDQTTTGSSLLTVQMTFENVLNLTNQFSISREVYVEPNTTVGEIMDQLAQKNPSFRFEFGEFAGLGRYVSAINGVTASHAEQTFWAIIVQSGQQEACLSDWGIDFLQPEHMDHIVLSFRDYSVFDDMTSCSKISLEDHGASNNDTTTPQQDST